MLTFTTTTEKVSNLEKFIYLRYFFKNIKLYKKKRHTGDTKPASSISQILTTEFGGHIRQGYGGYIQQVFGGYIRQVCGGYIQQICGGYIRRRSPKKQSSNFLPFLSPNYKFLDQCFTTFFLWNLFVIEQFDFKPL